jgi:hypothetical protein
MLETEAAPVDDIGRKHVAAGIVGVDWTVEKADSPDEKVHRLRNIQLEVQSAVAGFVTWSAGGDAAVAGSVV